MTPRTRSSLLTVCALVCALVLGAHAAPKPVHHQVPIYVLVVADGHGHVTLANAFVSLSAAKAAMALVPLKAGSDAQIVLPSPTQLTWTDNDRHDCNWDNDRRDEGDRR